MDILKRIIVTEIKEITTVFSPRGRYTAIKNRFCYGLSFCESGKITYTHCGRDFVSDVGCAVFLPKGASYTIYGNESGGFPVINFECTGLKLDTFLTVPLRNPESYLKDYKAMKNLSLFESTLSKQLSIFYDILSRIQTEGYEDNGAMRAAIRKIEKSFSDPELNNRILADSLHISEVYFRRLFKESFGIAPKQYITDIRIKKAKQLLIDTDSTVTQISEQCGFSSVYHFCRIFKEKTGLTPTEYAKHSKIYGL